MMPINKNASSKNDFKHTSGSTSSSQKSLNTKTIQGNKSTILHRTPSKSTAVTSRYQVASLDKSIANVKRRRIDLSDDDDDEDDYEEEFGESQGNVHNIKKKDYVTHPNNRSSLSVSGSQQQEGLNALTLTDRVSKLELELVALKSQLEKSNENRTITIENIPSLGAFAISSIGKLVRDEMFRAIKFLDALTLKKEGALLFSKCCEVAMLTKGFENNPHAYEVVIKHARRALNIHKCHVKHKIRQAALGKQCVLLFFSLYRNVSQ
jgi:hypothetical protein